MGKAFNSHYASTQVHKIMGTSVLNSGGKAIQGGLEMLLHCSYFMLQKLE